MDEDWPDEIILTPPPVKTETRFLDPRSAPGRSDWDIRDQGKGVAEPEQLRQWAAQKVMGWDLHEDHYCLPDSVCAEPPIISPTICRIMATKEDTSFGTGWRPDDPTTGQIWMVVEKMRELGWRMEFYLELGNKDFFGRLADKGYIAKFAKDQNIGRSVDETNPCLAILKAAWEALEGHP